MNIPPKYEDVVAQLEAALAEVERLKNIDHRQILAESAAKYLLDSGAENFIGDVFTIEADDGLVKFEVIVTTQKIGAKSPGEVCSDLQQRLTVAEQRLTELLAFLAKIEKNGLDGFNIDTGITVRDELRAIGYCLSIPPYEMKCITNPTSRLNTYKGEK